MLVENLQYTNIILKFWVRSVELKLKILELKISG